MNIVNDNNQKKGSLGKTLLAAAIVGIIILTVLSLPARIQNFQDSKYCLGSQKKYKSSYVHGAKNEQISLILKREVFYIMSGTGSNENVLLSCSNTSVSSPNFTMKDISVGDTIFKENFSNEFTIISNGEEYTFLIDSNSPELPGLD